MLLKEHESANVKVSLECNKGGTVNQGRELQGNPRCLKIVHHRRVVLI